MRGNIRLWWSFRSLYVPCYSVTTWPVNVPGWLSRHHPGDPGFRRKIAASRYLRLIPSGYRVGHEPASMQATPSRRIPAPRPGLQETPQRFTAGPGHRCKPSVILKATLSLLLSNYWGSLSPVGEGKGEGIRPHEYLKVKMPPPYHSEVLLFPHPTQYVPPRSPPIAA